MTNTDHAAKLAEACASAKALLINDLDEPGRTVFWKVTDALKAYQSDLATPSPDPVREGLVEWAPIEGRVHVEDLEKLIERHGHVNVRVGAKGAVLVRTFPNVAVWAAGYQRRAALTRAGVK